MIRDAGHRGWELAWTQPHRPHRRRRAAGRSPQVCLPLWELIGAFLGILAGITFGERASPLNPLGDVYAMMLLSVVYPYILSSLIVGLGSLRRLLQASWRVYLLLWVTVFATIFVLSQAVPPFEIEPPHPIAVNDHPDNLVLAPSPTNFFSRRLVLRPRVRRQ
jgi:hypothetical protein